MIKNRKLKESTSTFYYTIRHEGTNNLFAGNKDFKVIEPANQIAFLIDDGFEAYEFSLNRRGTGNIYDIEIQFYPDESYANIFIRNNDEEIADFIIKRDYPDWSAANKICAYLNGNKHYIESRNRKLRRALREDFGYSSFCEGWAKVAAEVAKSYLCNDEEDYDKIKSFESDTPMNFNHYKRGDAVVYINLREPFDEEAASDVLEDVKYMVEDDYDYFINKVNKECKKAGLDVDAVKKVEVDVVEVRHGYDSTKHSSTTYIFVAFDIDLKNPEDEPNYKHPKDYSNWSGPNIGKSNHKTSSYDAAGIGYQSYSSSTWK